MPIKKQHGPVTDELRGFLNTRKAKVISHHFHKLGIHCIHEIKDKAIPAFSATDLSGIPPRVVDKLAAFVVQYGGRLVR